MKVGRPLRSLPISTHLSTMLVIIEKKMNINIPLTPTSSISIVPKFVGFSVPQSYSALNLSHTESISTQRFNHDGN